MYILACADGSYYTGSTRDLERRLAQHETGTGPHYTRTRRPLRLVYTETFDRIDEAFRREKQVQGWSRQKKDALVHGHPTDLPHLSTARPRTSP